MKQLPLVSMIVPVYNKRAYLESSVNCLRAQTYANLEIILVDDGSTDGSGELCDSFAREDPRIRVIHQANGGVSSARNTGLDAARGEYIYFLDGDDLVLDTMAEEMAAIYEREGCDLCVGGTVVHDENDESKNYCRCYPKSMLFQFRASRKKQRFLCRWVLHFRFGWATSSQMFRRDMIERHHLRFKAGQKIYEDIDFFFRYVACCQNLRYVPKAFYIYQQYADSVMHTNRMWEHIYWMLRLTRSWEGTFQGRDDYPPLYICAGVVYVHRFADPILETEEDWQQLVETFDFIRASENGEWLLGLARLAVRNRVRILRMCGLGLGLRICAFYKSILTGDMSAVYSVNRLRIWGETLYSWKRNLLPGRERNTT